MEKTVPVHYYPNRLEVTQGKNKLKLTQFRAGPGAVFVTCKGCSTPLVCSHPTYGTGILGTYPDVSPVEGVNDLGKPLLRCWLMDWPEEVRR